MGQDTRKQKGSKPLDREAIAELTGWAGRGTPPPHVEQAWRIVQWAIGEAHYALTQEPPDHPYVRDAPERIEQVHEVIRGFPRPRKREWWRREIAATVEAAARKYHEGCAQPDVPIEWLTRRDRDLCPRECMQLEAVDSVIAQLRHMRTERPDLVGERLRPYELRRRVWVELRRLAPGHPAKGRNATSPERVAGLLMDGADGAETQRAKDRVRKARRKTRKKK